MWQKLSHLFIIVIKLKIFPFQSLFNMVALGCVSQYMYKLIMLMHNHSFTHISIFRFIRVPLQVDEVPISTIFNTGLRFLATLQGESNKTPHLFICAYMYVAMLIVPQFSHLRYHVSEDIHMYHHTQFPNNWRT